ncbi:MAG: hypothetical protein J1E62_09970 [Lachnospiraceae bacterium]|nr:hypothetical protein [Lachnospiraceae bacterium]
MPFIDSKVTVALTPDKEESIKQKLGQAITTMGKTEGYLMVGFEDEYSLYLGGKKLDKGAFVSVRALGQVRSDQCDEMTGKISKILDDELGIPAENIYVSYQGIADWGWNGRNF